MTGVNPQQPEELRSHYDARPNSTDSKWANGRLDLCNAFLDESSFCATGLERFGDGDMPASYYLEIIFWQ